MFCIWQAAGNTEVSMPDRFPPPWTVEDTGAAFVGEGQQRSKTWLFLL
jgi:hypothetical protein